MPAVKDVLRHVTIETAGKRRKCYRHPKDHVIVKGEQCMVVKDGPQDQSTYCLTCASEILQLAQTRLADLAARAVLQLQ
ncbi:MAG: hypothetical protein AB7H92_03690 [Microbacteriaceae bacterium]